MFFALALIATLDSAVARGIQLAPDEVLQTTIVGSGRPVVLIPGLIGSAFAYRKILPSLEQAGYQLIVIEPLGVGASGRPAKADYSLTKQADRIAAVMDTLQVSNAVVVAHSAGVSMALRLAYRRPELVSGILAVNGGPIEEAATPGVRQAVKFSFLIKLFGGDGMVRSQIRKGLIHTAGDTSWVTDEVLNGYTQGRAGDLGSVLRAMKGMAKAKEPERLADHLGEIQAPVHLLIGGAPHGSGVPNGLLPVMQQLPRLVVDTIPGAGLHIHEEQPDVVIKAVEAMAAE